jgi:5-methylcytosine-specific restriction protein A
MPFRPQVHRPGGAFAAQRQAQAKARPNTTERGYGWAWQKLRKAFAATVPAICEVCGYAGTSAEMELDHRLAKSKGGTDDPANLRWLCGARSVARGGRDCHGVKTAKEDGSFGRPPKSTPKN